MSLVCAHLVYGQGHQASAPVKTGAPDKVAAERGQTLFKSNCGFCHGEDAGGGRGPGLVRSTILSHDENGNLIGAVIRNGRIEKGMPAFSALKDDQVADIVAFLHYRLYAASHNANVPGDYPLAKLMTGNAEAGKLFYEGAGGCAGCHTVKDMAAVVAKYQPVDLQQHIVYPQGNHTVRTATVTTTDGQHYQGTIKNMDEFNIGIVCQDGWFRSWPMGEVKVEVTDPLAAHRELTTKLTDTEMHNLFAYVETMK